MSLKKENKIMDEKKGGKREILLVYFCSQVLRTWEAGRNKERR